MPRRIDIELTSARPDGSWTWRVSGARQPKGVLDGSLLPAGAKVGDVLRAEAESELDGTTILSVAQPPGKRPDPERLELLTDARPFEGVTTSLVPKSTRPRRDHDDRGPRRDRGERGPLGGREGRGPRTDRPEGRPGPRREGETGPARAHGEGRDGEGAGRGAGEGRTRAPREGAPTDRGARPPAAASRGRAGTRPPARRPDGHGPANADGAPEGDRAPSGPGRPKRLSPASTHRNRVLDALAPEERAVAEQLLHGGIPAVRRAVQEQNAKAKEEGRPEVKADALLALAEELLPRLKSAEWRDRAEAAAKDVDDIGLRDLRSVVAGADAGARDDESRILAKTLREALDRRDAAARDAWVVEITTHLDEGRVARALRVSGRPPDPRTRFPAELAARLTDEASRALGPETTPERWAALLAAVLESPVRRSVKPAGLPPSPPEPLLSAARQASGRVPALAAMLGLQMPPPPGPPRGARPPLARTRGGPARPAPPAHGAHQPPVVPADDAHQPPVVPADDAHQPPALPAQGGEQEPAPPARATEQPGAQADALRAEQPGAEPDVATAEPAGSSQPVPDEEGTPPPPGQPGPGLVASTGPVVAPVPPQEPDAPAASDGQELEAPAASDGQELEATAASAGPEPSVPPAGEQPAEAPLAPAPEAASSVEPADEPREAQGAAAPLTGPSAAGRVVAGPGVDGALAAEPPSAALPAGEPGAPEVPSPVRF